MATRSTIALEFTDGSVQQIYCHWDGYLDNNGRILYEHYQDPAKVLELISLGDLSSLGPDIGVKHEFDCPHKFGTPEYQAWSEHKQTMCTFYNRDRDEDLRSARVFRDFEDYRVNHAYEEFEYILRNNGHWYVFQGDAYQRLDRALEEYESLQES